jgi:hypothetical protein
MLKSRICERNKRSTRWQAQFSEECPVMFNEVPELIAEEKRWILSRPK